MSACPHCHVPISGRRRAGMRLATRDHIIPKAWGGGDILWWSRSLGPEDLVRNTRIICEQCNSLRAICGHCIGAMACVMTVARVEQRQPRKIAKQWGMQRVANLIGRPAWLWWECKEMEEDDALKAAVVKLERKK